MNCKDKDEKIIKSKDRVKKHAEVYTPEWVVNDMLDMLKDESDCDPYKDIDATFLEPAAGNGNFVVKILERKLAYAKTDDEKLRALKSIYAVELLQDNVEEMKVRIRTIMSANGITGGYDDIMDINIQQGDFLKMTHADGTDIEFYDWRGGTGYHTLRSMLTKQTSLDFFINNTNYIKYKQTRENNL